MNHTSTVHLVRIAARLALGAWLGVALLAAVAATLLFPPRSAA